MSRTIDLRLLLAGVGLAALAVAAALGLGQGDVDPDDSRPPVVETPPARRGLPGLGPLDAVAPAARARLETAWPVVRSGTPTDAARALEGLVAGDAGTDLRASAAPLVTAMAPALEFLARGSEPRLALAALRVAAVLARDGGDTGRDALLQSGFVERVMGVLAWSGEADLQQESIRLLGHVGVEEAVGWLRILAASEDAAIAATAVRALGEAHGRGASLAGEPAAAVLAAFDRPGAPPDLRAASLRVFRIARDAFRPEEVDARVAAALTGGDGPGVRLEAAMTLDHHPWNVAEAAVRAAVADPEPEIAVVASNVVATRARFLEDRDAMRAAVEARLATTEREDLRAALDRARAALGD